MSNRPTRLLLIGGGHSHVEVLRRFALQPDPAVALTLVSPDPLTAYSGMLPGLIAGHYSLEEAHIALPPLAAWAGTRHMADSVEAIDLYTKTAILASGHQLAFDLVSIDVGSTPDASVPGAREHVFAVKPVTQFLEAWTRIQAEAAEGRVRTIGVVGGGAGGVEVLLAMQFRLQATLGASAPRFALVTDAPTLLPRHPGAVRARLGRILVERGAVLHFDSAALRVEAGTVIVTGRRRVAMDRIVWATSASAQPWLAAAGLECDARGFVEVDEHLRSTSHPFVFAAGDCASQRGEPRPKSGVYAVRQGPPLAANLRRSANGEALLPYVPQRDALALISTGGKHAIATRGPFSLEGDWVWTWKDWIDRRFMARYVPPADSGAATVRAGD